MYTSMTIIMESHTEMTSITESGVKYEVSKNEIGDPTYHILSIDGVDVYFQSIFLHHDHKIFLEQTDDDEKYVYISGYASGYTDIWWSLVEYGFNEDCITVSEHYEPPDKHKAQFSEYLL